MQIFYCPAWWWATLSKQDSEDCKHGLARIYRRRCFPTASHSMLFWLDRRFSKEAAPQQQFFRSCPRSDDSIASFTHLIVPHHCEPIPISFRWPGRRTMEYTRKIIRFPSADFFRALVSHNIPHRRILIVRGELPKHLYQPPRVLCLHIRCSPHVLCSSFDECLASWFYSGR